MTHIRTAVVEEVHEGGLATTHTAVHVESFGCIVLGGKETKETTGRGNWFVPLDLIVYTL